MLTKDRIEEDVRELLDPDSDEFDEYSNLIDHGLDSVRLMALAERWRSLGIEFEFVDLMEEPTLERWCVLLGVSEGVI